MGRRDTDSCSIEGCDRSFYARELCVMHYSRLRSNGDSGPAEPLRSEYGGGSVTSQGYRILRRPGHPLAAAQGKVFEHRVVLYEAIGAGTHECHWCHQPVSWEAGGGGEPLVVDHLDGDRLHNEPSNLVPSCFQCNAKRGS